MFRAMDCHSLSCHRNPGRLSRHYALNDVIYRALAAAGLPAILKPRGQDLGDGLRPDVITFIPFRRGKMLIWDPSCPNTFSTYTINCASAAGVAAHAAGEHKCHRYAALVQRVTRFCARCRGDKWSARTGLRGLDTGPRQADQPTQREAPLNSIAEATGQPCCGTWQGGGDV